MLGVFVLLLFSAEPSAHDTGVAVTDGGPESVARMAPSVASTVASPLSGALPVVSERRDLQLTPVPHGSFVA